MSSDRARSLRRSPRVAARSRSCSPLPAVPLRNQKGGKIAGQIGQVVDVVADQARQQIAVVILRVFLLRPLQAGPEAINLLRRREHLLFPQGPAELRRPGQGHGEVCRLVPGIFRDPLSPPVPGPPRRCAAWTPGWPPSASDRS